MTSKTWMRSIIGTAALTALLSAPAMAQTRASVYVQIAPPAPQVEVVPTARPGQVWVPGHWKWGGSQYVWIAGHFQSRRVGYIYMPARWVQVGSRWEYREGVWVRPTATLRDSDGDGIADRFDQDRDGDGIPNRVDAQKDSPNRVAPRGAVYVEVAPPAPQVEVVPQPRRGQVWVPGHWKWGGSQYVWVPGHFQNRRAGYIYVPEHWVQVGGRWEFRPGTWTRPNNTLRDSDGDGIADRYDRDRDGDGTPNRFDSRKDNPNRN